jgi:tripartite ATP-independent transporter DctM subunit
VNFAIALTATTATIGVIIPPSVTMIVYGSSGNVSIGGLFMAGIVPGVVLTTALMLYCYYHAIRNNMPAGPRTSLAVIGRSFKGAFIPLWIPVILVGGVVSGQFTATESGVVGVTLALFLGIVVYRTLKLGSLPETFKEAALTYSLPLFAVATAMVFGWLIAYLEAPVYIGEILGPLATNPTAMMLFLVIVFVVLGTFLDAIAAIIIMMPVIEHLVALSGANPIHTGLVVIMTLAMGHLTPPFGLALFLACAIMKQPLIRVLPTLVPFYVWYLTVVLMVAVFPEISLFLPRFFLGSMVG